MYQWIYLNQVSLSWLRGCVGSEQLPQAVVLEEALGSLLLQQGSSLSLSRSWPLLDRAIAFRRTYTLSFYCNNIAYITYYAQRGPYRDTWSFIYLSATNYAATVA